MQCEIADFVQTVDTERRTCCIAGWVVEFPNEMQMRRPILVTLGIWLFGV